MIKLKASKINAPQKATKIRILDIEEKVAKTEARIEEIEAKATKTDPSYIVMSIVVLIISIVLSGSAMSAINQIMNKEVALADEIKIVLSITDSISNDKEILAYTKSNDIENFKRDVEKLVDERWYQKSENFTNEVKSIISIVAIFFIVLIVIMLLFHYLKTKKFEYEYQKLKEQSEVLSKTLTFEKEKNKKTFDLMTESLTKQRQQSEEVSALLVLEKEKNEKTFENMIKLLNKQREQNEEISQSLILEREENKRAFENMTKSLDKQKKDNEKIKKAMDNQKKVSSDRYSTFK